MSELFPLPSFLLPDLTRVVTGISGGGDGFGSGCLFRSRSFGLTVTVGGVVLAVVLTDTSGFRVTPDPDLGPVVVMPEVGARVTGTLPTGLVGAIPVVGITKVLTTVVVIELKIRVVVVTVVDPSPWPSSLGPRLDPNPVIVLVGSVAVPRIVLDPMMVDTNVLGGITVVKTEVIVRGESRV